MSEIENDKTQNSDEADQKTDNGCSHPPFPEKWKGLLEKEVEYLDKQRLKGQKVEKETIDQQKQILLKWSPPTEKEDIENEEGFEKAQLKFNAFQECLKLKISNLEKEVKEKETQTNNTKKDVALKHEKLKNLLESKENTLKRVHDLETTKTDLEKEFQDATGYEKILLEQELKQIESEHEFRKNISGEGGILDEAISDAHKDWLDARSDLVDKIAGEDSQSQESFTIEIERKKKFLEYIELHKYCLMKMYLSE